MKRFLFLLAAAAVGLVIAHCSNDDKAATKQEIMAKRFVTDLTEANYDSVIARLDSTMVQNLPPDKLDYIFKSLTGQFGEFKGLGGTRQAEAEGYQMVYVTMLFEQMMLDAKVVFDSLDRVAGLFFAPTPPDAVYSSADYVDVDAFEEGDVTFGDSMWTLSGTVSMPKGDGPFPAVVLVHGSGPNDRDETVGVCKPFRDIAEGLASRGVAVLRYDKRTFTHGKKFSLWETYTVKDEVVDDALAAVELLSEIDEVDKDRIVVLGHSLGGMLVPRIAARGSLIDAYVILAGGTRPLEDHLLEQTEFIYRLDGDLSEQEQAALDQIRSQVGIIKLLQPGTAVIRGDLPLGTPASYWLDLKGYNPPEAAINVRKPMLILQAERDYQVTMEDFENWKAALGEREDVTLKSYPALNHLFIAGEGQSTPNDYFRQGHVNLQVIEDIAGWIGTL